MRLQFCISIVLLSLIAGSSFSQATLSPAVTAEMRAAANDAYQKEDWSGAVRHFEAILKLEPQNVGARYRLGMSLLNMDMKELARASLSQAFEASPNAMFGLALARANARLGMKDAVYTVFERSLTLGGISADSLNSEKDFASLRTDPKFTDFVKKLDAVANPCRSRPEFRQFDFWIGEWNAQNPQGVTVGTSSIQLILKDCIIFENWNTPVSQGKSFNLFDTRDGKWHQTWVDARGSMTQYVGGLIDGKMVLDAESVQNGRKTINRMTFTKLTDGSVRQHGESSADEGRTWTTTFDFKYVKSK